MSFWRRWLKQWGYVRIRDYGLVVTEAGQVIRISDGVVVNASTAPLLPGPAAVHPPLPAPASRPPAPAPVHPPASAEPAPVFAPAPRLPLPPVAEPARPTRELRRPKPTRPPSRTAAGTAPPPLPKPFVSPPIGEELREDTAVTESEPTMPEPPPSIRPLPRLTGRPRIPPRPETETTLTPSEGFDAPVGDATVVDGRPNGGVPLPRLSARLAARRKSG